MSQYKLSYISDIPKSQIIRIEQGEVNTSISSISILAKAFEIQSKELFEL